MDRTPEVFENAVNRLTAAFKQHGLIKIDRMTGVVHRPLEGVLYFYFEDGNYTTSGQLLPAPHWKQLMVMHKDFFPPQPDVRLRMRDLRRMGIKPSKAAEIVLEHYYREG